MPARNCSAVGVFRNHQDAETAVEELRKSGYDMKKLSVVGNDYQTEGHVIDYHDDGNRLAGRSKIGPSWDMVGGLPFGSAFLSLPDVGPVMVGGALVSWMIGALETAASTADSTVLASALGGVGIPGNDVLRYETALKAGKFVLIAHGTAREVEGAGSVLTRNKAEVAVVHGVLPGPCRPA